MVLNFTSVAKAVLITHHNFGCCCTVLAQCHGFLFSHSGPCSKQARRTQETGKGHSLYSWPELAEGIFHKYDIMLGNKNWGRGRGWAQRWPSKAVIAQRLAGCQSACRRWWVIAFAQLVSFPLHLLNCLYANPRIVSLLLLLFSPSSHRAEAQNKWLCGCLAASLSQPTTIQKPGYYVFHKVTKMERCCVCLCGLLVRVLCWFYLFLYLFWLVGFKDIQLQLPEHSPWHHIRLFCYPCKQKTRYYYFFELAPCLLAGFYLFHISKAIILFRFLLK